MEIRRGGYKTGQSPLRTLGLALCAGVLAAGALGCHPAERAARAIADENAKARGGRDAWSKVRSMAMTGRLEAGVPRDPVQLAMTALRHRTPRKGEGRQLLADELEKSADKPGQKAVELPYRMEVKRPRKSRFEVRFQGENAVQVWDGQQGYKLRPFLGRREVELYSPDEQKLALQQSALDGPLMDYAASGRKIELLGSETIEGHDTHKIAITTETGDIRTLWVDKQTHLEVRIDGSRRLDGKSHPVYTYFRDYRAVGGLLIPHLLETVVDGVPGSEKIVVEQVVVNPPLDDERFTRTDLDALAHRAPTPASPTPAPAAPAPATPAN